MKNTLINSFLFAGIMALSVGLVSCDDDESFAAPTIELSETSVTASPGDEVSITIDAAAAAGVESFVITKIWDGTPQDSETLTEIPATYNYTVTAEDADHVLTISFTLTDKEQRSIGADLVVTVELTSLQILLKYNWRLSEEIRAKTNEDDITDAYNDDVYQFNADGTYEKSIGAKADAFGDLITNYCFYDLNETTMRLLMSRSENFFGTDAVDTLDITIIDETKMYADITYYGLDAFNDGSQDVAYESVEDYEKRFVAVAKTSSFDPYNPGADDDTGPGECREVELNND
jgi:hypothetical protein